MLTSPRKRPRDDAEEHQHRGKSAEKAETCSEDGKEKKLSTSQLQRLEEMQKTVQERCLKVYENFFWTPCVEARMSPSTAKFFSKLDYMDADWTALNWVDWLFSARNTWTPLNIACSELHVKLVKHGLTGYKAWYLKQLQQSGPDKEYVCYTNPEGCFGCDSLSCMVPDAPIPVPSLALVASANGLLPIHIVLKKWGVKRPKMCEDFKNRTLEILDMLIKEDPRTVNALCYKETLGNYRWWKKYDTPLSLAIKCGQPREVLKMLVNAGARVYSMDLLTGEEQAQLQEVIASCAEEVTDAAK